MNLIRCFAIFKRNKFIFNPPPKVEVIIYGCHNSTLIASYLERYSFDVYNEGILNVYILLKCVFQFNLTSANYLSNYILHSKARIVITSIDNDERFWDIKTHVPNVTTILLQYAWHGEAADIFWDLIEAPPNKKYRIDYLFMYNRNIGKKYAQYIDGDFFYVGNFKNNHYICKVESEGLRNTVVFISQYRPEQPYHPVFFYTGETAYLRDSFYESEQKLLPLLYDFCRSNNLVLQIVGHGETSREHDFFCQMIGNEDWSFLARTGPFDSYKAICAAKIVVGVDSSLVYESFGRGLRTGLFSERSRSLDLDSYCIGWPCKLPQQGPFWTDNICEQEVVRVCNLLLNGSDLEWNGILNTYREELMNYDSGNAQLVSVLKDLR